MSTSASNRSLSIEPLLELAAVGAGYAGTRVLNDLSLSVKPGQVVAIVGPNGSGKSTLLDTICGLVPWRRGRIVFRSVDITHWKVHRIIAAGIGYSPQGRRLFPYMSAEANLRIGGYTRHDRKAMDEDIARFFDRWPVVGERRRHTAGLLSGGEQQIASIGRALMSNPQLLLLDEPSLGLAPVLVNQLYEMIGELVQERRQTLVIVEQNVRQALKLAEYVYVLVSGQVVHESVAADVSPADIVDMYFKRVDHRPREVGRN